MELAKMGIPEMIPPEKNLSSNKNLERGPKG